MTTIAIFPDTPNTTPKQFRAVSGAVESVGATVGQALDALTAQLGGAEETVLVVVQSVRPDAFFTAAQQQRLAELMDRWRLARDKGTTLSPRDQAELDGLVEAELRAASERSAALVRQLPS